MNESFVIKFKNKLKSEMGSVLLMPSDQQDEISFQIDGNVSFIDMAMISELPTRN